MKNVTGSDRHMAEQDDRSRPDAGTDPRGEDIRGVGDDEADFDEGDEDDLAEDEEDDGSF